MKNRTELPETYNCYITGSIGIEWDQDNNPYIDYLEWNDGTPLNKEELQSLQSNKDLHEGLMGFYFE
jgi:hypothetical protein